MNSCRSNSLMLRTKEQEANQALVDQGMYVLDSDSSCVTEADAVQSGEVRL